MERNLFSLLAAGIVFSAAVWGWNQAGHAAFCGKCRDMMFIDSQGKCMDCGGPTTSGALQLCPKCSLKRHQCEHCLVTTTATDETASQNKPADPPPQQPNNNDSHSADSHRDDTQAKPPLVWTVPANNGDPARPDEASAQPPGPEINRLPPAARTGKPTPLETLPENRPPAELPPDLVASAKPKPINPAKAGTYTSGRWRYQLQITSADTRSEGRWGWLTYDGQKLSRGDVNDYYDTPWGPIYWVDVPTTAWGFHGWMPVPLAQNRRQGRALAGPNPADTRGPAPPTSVEAAAPTRPRVQMLEVNQSHNGQSARLRVGNVLVIRLPGNPATGYQWQAATTNSPAMRLTVRPQYSSPASTGTSAAPLGTYTFIFQAVQPGTGSIRLYYVHPSDPNRPRDSFALGVNVSAVTAAATARPAIPAIPAASRANEHW